MPDMRSESAVPASRPSGADQGSGQERVPQVSVGSVNAASRIDHFWQPGTFPTAESRCSNRGSLFPPIPTPGPRGSHSDMSTSKENGEAGAAVGASRPNTQGGPRVLFSREHTVMEEKDDDRRHIYTAYSHSRLKSRGEDKARHRQFPTRSLADLSEEERSRRTMQCSLCEGCFVEPKVFCCTRLCKKCLQGHIDISELDSKVVCLVCRGEVEVPDKKQPRDTWADQFRTDFFLQRLQEVSQQLKDKHDCYVCESSKNKKTVSTIYCFDCDTYFCESCNDMHLQLRGLTSHCTAALDCLQPRDIMSRRRVFCEKHRDRYIERFCGKCDALLCHDCVEENHRKCPVFPTQQIATDRRRVVESLKYEFDASIRRAEEEDELLRDRGSRMQNRVSQRKEEIETAFSRIEKAVAERKKRLLEDIDDDSLQDGRGNQNKLSQLQLLIDALKDNGVLAEEMVSCGSDRDIIQSADDLIRQCKTLSEVTHNTARFAHEQPTSMARVDNYSVHTFLTLLAGLGEDFTERVVAFKTRQLGLRMTEDKESPSVKDMLLLDNNILLVTDNSNKCLKALVPGQEPGGHRSLQLPLKTRPWGITLTQPNVVAVSGHQCLYIITVSEQALTLQTTVRTRKDYWSITSLSPINVAGACKFPPSVDIVDITGRRLRTIEGERNGVTIFRQPYFLTSLNGNILMTDRLDRTLICLDQAGEVKFVRKSKSSSSSNSEGGSEEQHHLRGICTDSQNRIFLVDGPHVFMLSPQGKQLCQILTGLPDARAISVGRDNVLAVSMDGRGVTFFTMCELKGPF